MLAATSEIIQEIAKEVALLDPLEQRILLYFMQDKNVQCIFVKPVSPPD